MYRFTLNVILLPRMYRVDRTEYSHDIDVRSHLSSDLSLSLVKSPCPAWREPRQSIHGQLAEPWTRFGQVERCIHNIRDYLFIDRRTRLPGTKTKSCVAWPNVRYDAQATNAHRQHTGWDTSYILKSWQQLFSSGYKDEPLDKQFQAYLHYALLCSLSTLWFLFIPVMPIHSPPTSR